MGSSPIALTNKINNGSHSIPIVPENACGKTTGPLLPLAAAAGHEQRPACVAPWDMLVVAKAAWAKRSNAKKAGVAFAVLARQAEPHGR